MTKILKNKVVQKGLFLMALTLVVSSCNSNIPLSGTNSDVEDNSVQIEQAKKKAILQNGGVSSFRMVRASMANSLGLVLTGATPICNTEFENAKSNLSESFNPDNLSDAAQASVYELALCFCNQFVANAALRAALLPNVNFGAAPATSLSDSAKMEIANAFVDAAWDPSLKTSEDVQDIVTLLNEIAPLAPQTAAGTQSVVATSCAVVLAAFQAISL